MKQKSTIICLVVLALFSLSAPADAQHAKTNTRVFWVDRDTQKLTWGDVITTDKWSLKTGTVEGFPAADSKNNRVGPLYASNGLVVAGVSGMENDSTKGRWFAIDAGVFQEPHGNHFHWKYTGRPAVTQTVEDDRQGSTRRVGSNGDRLYLFGDHGFTAANLNNLKMRGTTTASGQFFPVNDRPVSQLAVVDNVVGYSAWENEDGELAGQVDVIKLADAADLAYSFKLPSGNISATTVNNGKVFFAHQDAVSWVTPDRNCSLSGDKVEIKTVSLPTNQQYDAENPPQALVNEKNWVIFAMGAGESSKLCMINAAVASPSIIALPITVSEGLRLSPPSTVLSVGKRYAFVFQERIEPSSDVQEQLTIVELDPNRDMNFDDARIAKTIPVGSSLIQDNSGSHQICFDDYGRFAVFTSPGDGTLSVISMHDLILRVNFKVGGVPTEIVAVGAPEHFH